MLLAALVHAGAEVGAVEAGVRALGVPGWRLEAAHVRRGAIAATHVKVSPVEDPGAGGHPPATPPVPGVTWTAARPPHGHVHAHDHGHGHGHTHDHAELDVFPGQPSRAWRDIRRLLEDAALPARARTRAVAVFALLAEAEGRVHGMPADEVTFHEVGAVDSIVDIVGACIALELLDVSTIVCGPLPMGHGTVRTAHGILPVPAPATLEVLRGFPVAPSPWQGELVTPTGAAFVAALAQPGGLPPMQVSAIGYGAGTRDPTTHANVLRVVLGDGPAGSPVEVVEVRAQVDDLPGEHVPGLLRALLDAGALDAWTTHVAMKKGRPGLLVTALCAPDVRARVGDAMFRHGGTLGYRWSAATREVCARRWVTVVTEHGEVRMKIAEREGRVVHVAPEFEDVAARASAVGVPEVVVHAAALAAWSDGRLADAGGA
jgi:uncharacterized protein (TIGR00299 family) protein